MQDQEGDYSHSRQKKQDGCDCEGKRPGTDGLQSRKKPAGLLYAVFLKYSEASYLLLDLFQLQTLVLGLSF